MSAQLRHEDVAPDAGLFLALVRGRIRAPGVPDLDDAIRAARSRTLPRDALADAIGERLRGLDAPAESLAAAERLRAPGVVAVVAGQQPMLLGGPSLVFVKALAAVALARKLEARGVPAVPVFWNAAEDHDHAEASSVRILTREGAIERLSVPLPQDRAMLSATRIPPEAAAVLARLAEILPDGPGRDEVLAATALSGESMSAWCARILLRLLGRFGLVLVEPETLRPFAIPVVRHEIQHPGALAATIREVERDVALAHGFPAPLALPHPELFFSAENGVRHRPDVTRLAPDAAESGTWSWNVAGRVLAQDTALPVAAQVCGPAELAYCSMLVRAHGLLGVPCPAFVARPGVTLVDGRVRSLCDELGVRPIDVVRSAGNLPEPQEVKQTGAFDHVRAVATELPEGRGPAARRRRADMLKNLDLYAEAIAREAQERADTADSRRRRVLDALRPEGKLQERELSILSFVAKHGTVILDRMLEAVSAEGAEHVVLDVVDG